MSDRTLATIELDQRIRLASQLDDVVRQLQVLQGVLRADQPTMPLATASTALIGVLITTREVNDAVGMAEAEAIADDVVPLTGAERRYYDMEA